MLITGLLLSLLALFSFATSAQTQPPLVGPLMAVAPASHDEIVLYDVTTDTYRSLDFGASWVHVWDFSPDGCRVLFTMSDSPTSLARLYSARIDGHDMQPLISYIELPAADWGIWEPDWSPDNSRIAFKMIRERDGERETHIAWIPPDGGEPEFYSVTGREHEPAWSPDGEWLVYISYDERVPGADISATAIPTPDSSNNSTPVTLISEADLWVVSADGETKFNLSSFPTGSVRAPRWSPDGALISFIYSPAPGNDTFWMIGAAPEAIPTQLNFEWVLILDTTWQPDSTHIIGSARSFRNTLENRLWQIPLVGNADETAQLYAPNAGITHADYPRFSADGRYLATRTAYDLALVDTSDGTSRLLDSHLQGNTPVVWSPTGFAGESSCNTP